MRAIGFSQHYYTHCHRGLGATSGWQTKAKSVEIDQSISKLLEKHVGTYNIPLGNDAYDLDNQPVSFRSIALGPDLWCISLTQYVGKGFQVSSGNFFAHSLICSRSDFRQIGANPFHILRANPFVKADPTEDLKELETLTVTPKPSPVEDVFSWVRNRYAEPNRQRLVDLLDAVILARGLKPQRPVILVLAEEEMLNLMEGLICMLPLSLRLATSFSTYDRNPYPLRDSNPVVNNMLEFVMCRRTVPAGQSDFKFSRTEYTHAYFVFNFDDNSFSFEDAQFKQISRRTQYASWVCDKLLQKDYQEIYACHEFMEPYNLDDQTLDTALAAYYFDDAIRDRDTDMVEQATGFLESSSDDPQAVERNLNALLTAIDVARDCRSIEYLVRLMGAAMSVGVRDPELVKVVYEKYLQLFRDSVERGRRNDATEYMDMSKRLPDEFQVRLPLELGLTRGRSQFIVPLLSSSMELLKQQPEYEEDIYMAYVGCLKEALDQEEKDLPVLTDLAEGLPDERRITLPGDLSGPAGWLECQIPLLSKALDILLKSSVVTDPVAEPAHQEQIDMPDEVQDESQMSRAQKKAAKKAQKQQQKITESVHQKQVDMPDEAQNESQLKEAQKAAAEAQKRQQEIAEPVYQRYFDMLNEALSERRVNEVYELMKMAEKLPESRQKELEENLYNRRDILSKLLGCLDNPTDASLDLLKLWFPKAFDMWMFKNPVENHLRATIGYMTENDLVAHYGLVVFEIVQKAMESKQIDVMSPGLMLELCKFADGVDGANNKMGFYVKELLPRAIQLEDSRPVKAATESAARESAASGTTNREMQRFLENNPSMFEVIVDVYPHGDEKILGEWLIMCGKTRYKKSWESGSRRAGSSELGAESSGNANSKNVGQQPGGKGNE